MKRWMKVAAWLLLAAITIAALSNAGFLDRARLTKGASNALAFLTGLFPPAWNDLPKLFDAMLETLQIAWLGTLFGFIFALPVSLLSTRTIFSPMVTAPARLLLALVRTIPSLLWALIFVAAFGLGPLAGTCAISFYTLGYLGTLFYEAFEGVDREVLEAVSGVGCGRWQLMRYALLPEAANQILGQLLFVFEYNVRASSIMGFVGAGGIGFYMLGYVQLLLYQNLLTAILVTLMVVVAIDHLSARVRRLVLAPS